MSTPFFERLDNWLLQQPEYPALFTADRPTRRRASRALAKQVLTIPARQDVETTRAQRRQGQKMVAKLMGKANTNMSKRRQRLLAKAERDRQRFLRMSQERRVQLLQREMALRAMEALEEADPALD